ncbi:MAG: tetratricopeptide repeat-containing sensor histidine kinase [Cyclobacteriaceae bacterium]
MKAIHFIVFYLLLASAFCQKPLRDSLIKDLENHPTLDSTYINLLNALSFEYIKSEPSKALTYINEAIRLSDSIRYRSGLIRATTNKGNSFWVVGLQDQALSNYLLALSHGARDYPLDYARLNNNIGEVFKKKKLYDSALKYYTEASKVVSLVANQKPVIITCNIAEAFLLSGRIDSASHYFNLGLKFANESNHKRGLANALFGLSEINYRKGNLRMAIDQQKQSLSLGQEIEDVRGTIQSYLKLSEYYLSSNAIDSSSVQMNRAVTLSRSVNANDLLLEASYLEYRILTATNQYQKAAQILDTYQLLKDSLVMLEFTSSVERIKTSLLAEISSKENQLLIQSQKSTERTNRTRLIFLSTFSVLLIIILCLIYFFRESKRLVKHQFEKDILIEKLSLRNKNLGEFNSVISHNLREPLTQIIGYAKFYESSNPGITTGELINHIKKSSFRIDQTIRDLNTVLSDVEPNLQDYKSVDLEQTIRSVAGTFDERFTEVSVHIDYKSEGTISFRSYKPFILDIFHHLISNAIRFRDKERLLSVVVNVKQTDSETVIAFQDNGIGLDLAKTKGKLFKMYQKFHPDTPGRGVGLFIVKSRVDALKGEISVTSTVGTGTTLTLRLPIN